MFVAQLPVVICAGSWKTTRSGRGDRQSMIVFGSLSEHSEPLTLTEFIFRDSLHVLLNGSSLIWGLLVPFMQDNGQFRGGRAPDVHNISLESISDRYDNNT